MTLTVDLTPEEEARLVATARDKGVSVDAFVRSVLKDVAAQASNTIDAKKSPALPAWPGRVIGELRREDIILVPACCLKARAMPKLDC